MIFDPCKQKREKYKDQPISKMVGLVYHITKVTSWLHTYKLQQCPFTMCTLMTSKYTFYMSYKANNDNSSNQTE